MSRIEVAFFSEDDPDFCLEKSVCLPSSGRFMPTVLTLANRVVRKYDGLQILRVWLCDKDGHFYNVDLLEQADKDVATLRGGDSIVVDLCPLEDW